MSIRYQFTLGWDVPYQEVHVSAHLLFTTTPFTDEETEV